MTQARQANSTVTFVDEYCALYQDLFPDVRSSEHFKQVHVGMHDGSTAAEKESKASGRPFLIFEHPFRAT